MKQESEEATLRPEYDFSSGVRGKHHEAYRKGSNVVLLDPDVAAVFKDSDEVNAALRGTGTGCARPRRACPGSIELGRARARNRRSRARSAEAGFPRPHLRTAALGTFHDSGRHATAGVKVRIRTARAPDRGIAFSPAVNLRGDSISWNRPFRARRRLPRTFGSGRIGCLELLDHFHRPGRALQPGLERHRGVRLRAGPRAGAGGGMRPPLARGEVWGPLHGLPMTVKDSYDVAGLPTTWGVPELRDNVPATNAVAVAPAARGGGRSSSARPTSPSTSPTSRATTTSTEPPTTPGTSRSSRAVRPAAPRRPSRAGLTGLEAGSDIGGSIRNPAHYCGVYGLKATWGVLPLRGHAKPGVLAPTTGHLGDRPPCPRRRGPRARPRRDGGAGPDRGERLEAGAAEAGGPGPERLADRGVGGRPVLPGGPGGPRRGPPGRGRASRCGRPRRP